MEQIEITPGFTQGETETILESKKYKIPANNNIYELSMKAFDTERIEFKIRQSNKIVPLIYEKIFDYDKIAKILLLEKNYYNNIQKIFKFCDIALNKEKINIIPEIENFKRIKFVLKKSMDFDEVNCEFYLNEKKVKNEEFIGILTDEINNLKLKLENNIIIDNNNIQKNINDNNNTIIENLNEKIDKLIRNNEVIESKLNSIMNENITLKNKISELEKTIKNLETKNISLSDNNNTNSNNNKDTIISNNSNINSPEKLEFKEILSNFHSNSGFLRQFVVYKSIKDDNEYLVFNNKSKFSLDIIKISDKKLIHYLKGHKAKVSVIKYFISKSDNQEYLLSCDENKLVIIWNLFNYNTILKINTNMEGYIWDAYALLYVNGLSYFIIPSNSDKECTRVYIFNNYNLYNNNNYNEIFGTLHNKTNFVIPWNYNNNNYLIECCYSKISINNIFQNENYATLTQKPEGQHCCGYIYKEKYLLVTDYNNNFLRIWNLFTKSFVKEITFGGSYCYGVIPWNNDYSIMACSDGLIIIDINKGKMIKKIINQKAFNLCGLQKINSLYYGESIICSNSNNSIMIFNIK